MDRGAAAVSCEMKQAAFAAGVTCLFAVCLAGAQEAPPLDVAPGRTIERVRLPRAPEVDVGDRVATIVRVDLARYRFSFLTEARDGRRRPLDAWVRDHGLAGGINAGMFLPDGRTCGFLQERGQVLNTRRPAHWDAVIGFDPLRAGGAAFAIGGAGCPGGLDAMRGTHGSLLQSAHVLIDCAGRARTDWRTSRYSMAALGADREGRAVLVHVRTPYRMHLLARTLADLDLGIRGLVYMEGGPEASIVVRAGGEHLALMGSYEDGFWPRDDNHEMWDLPNVVGFAPR